MTVRDRDRGAQALLRRAQRRVSIRVGVMGSEASDRYEGGATVAMVAAAHELGLGVPERSWLRGWADENEDENAALMKRIARGIAKGDIPLEQLAEQTALSMTSGIQERISRGIPPPLSQTTIDRKGSSVPLIDTGQLRTSITGVSEVD